MSTLCKLKVLHVRCRARDAYSAAEEAFGRQRFANRFSSHQYMKGCANLRYFVVGIEPGYEFVSQEDEPYDDDLGQHCFIKGKMIGGPGGRTFTVVSVPIRFSHMRKIEPNLDIVELDPWCWWQTRKPGRFYDDLAGSGF